MEIHELPDKELKLIALKESRGLQENTDKLFNKICKIIQKQNEQFNKEIQNLKKELELKLQGLKWKKEKTVPVRTATSDPINQKKEPTNSKPGHLKSS